MKKILEKKNRIWLIFAVIAVVCVLFFRNFDVINFVKSINPQEGDFIKVGKISFPRFGHEAILLDDGRVLIFGGTTEYFGETAEIKKINGDVHNIEVYDPNTRKFTTIGMMNETLYDYAATKLKDGRILITGGSSENKSIKSTMFLNPKSGTLEKGPDMNSPRIKHSATLLNDGRVLISGGQELDLMRKKLPLAWIIMQSEIYDPKANKFIIAPSMNIPRSDHSTVVLKDGRVLIIGGVGKNKLTKIEIYNPKTNKYELAGSMNIARILPNAYVLKDGNVLISGGVGEDKHSLWLREIELYNPETKESKIITKRTSEPDMPTEVLLKDDKILFTGGSTGVGLGLVWYKTSEIFDPITNKFSKGKDMNYKKDGHRATLLKDGNVLITGSVGTGRTAELYINK